MDYVDWVAHVFTAVTQAHYASDTGVHRPVILSLQEITGWLGIQEREPVLYDTEAGMAVLGALSDLEKLGLVELAEHPVRHVLTLNGKKVAQFGLETMWPGIFACAEELDPGHLQLLTRVLDLGQIIETDHVRMDVLPLKDVCQTLGLDWGDRGHPATIYQAIDLAKLGLVKESGGRGGERVRITYAGAVLVTRKLATEWQILIRDLLPDWENTNVDFKRELNLKSDKDKAEFVRDILGLATTRCRGRRFLILGFGPKSHAFEVSVDPKIDQDRLERILHSWTEPTPMIRYVSVPWENGKIGIIEAIREEEKIPYKVKGNLGHPTSVEQKPTLRSYSS